MEQKENGWWKESFVERHVMPMGDIPKLEGEEIIAFISQVEQDARKDERERVMGKAIVVVEEEMNRLKIQIFPLEKEYNTEYGLWHRGIKTPSREKLLKEYEDGAKGNRLFSMSEKVEALADISTALKGLSDNKK